MELLEILYYLTFFAFVAVLFFKRNLEQNFKYLFLFYLLSFLVDFIIKLLNYNVQDNKGLISSLQKLYNILDILGIIVFYMVYSKQLRNKNSLLFIFIATFFPALYFLIISDQPYSIYVGICNVAFFILASLLWFYELVSKPDEVYIFRKPFFWISTSLLFWAVFFLFRMMPMYWLRENDLGLLEAIQISFVFVNIITYALMLKAVIIVKPK